MVFVKPSLQRKLGMKFSDLSIKFSCNLIHTCSPGSNRIWHLDHAISGGSEALESNFVKTNNMLFCFIKCCTLVRLFKFIVCYLWLDFFN